MGTSESLWCLATKTVGDSQNEIITKHSFEGFPPVEEQSRFIRFSFGPLPLRWIWSTSVPTKAGAPLTTRLGTS